MVSSRVGAEGGIALAKGLAAGAACCSVSTCCLQCCCCCLPCACCLPCGCCAGNRGPHAAGRSRMHPVGLHFLVNCNRRSPAATGLVRLDIHDNPITADFADDLAAVLARQAKVRTAPML